MSAQASAKQAMPNSILQPLSQHSTHDCLGDFNEKGFHIDESQDPIPAAYHEDPIFPVKKFGVFGSQSDILAPELINHINSHFEGKTKPEWQVKVTLG
eukprot:CAMPEP_0170481122 /NCGR_PEP_ID=MMETSP0208-20121228/1692_1 /TAXON_ID=197538 /ORGANISM="Strombidium inclinatum, Strain S3" /LENGTH=97 /DNA_ID=CAMNT_0010753771 /DNA_START=624 /DNA_END=917 /DNA_ORIENTATION=+